jgi:hypothetical protein
MVLLQSLDEFDEVALLDSDTTRISRLSKRAHPELSIQSVRGHFADLDDHQLYFYRGVDEKLHIRVDDTDVLLADDARATLVRQDARTNQFQVSHGGLDAIDLTYRRPVVDPPLELDPTPFISEEDFDICLFIYNVMMDEARRERIYRY